MAASQHRTPVAEKAPSILDRALTAAFAERIGELVEMGFEDLARRWYGEDLVDNWFRSVGWDPEAGRIEVAA